MTEPSDQEPSSPSTEFVDTTKPGSRRAYSNVRRELTEDEMAHPAVHRLIVSDIDLCENRIAELEQFQKDYYAADKQRAVLEERLKKATWFEILHDVALGMGFFFSGLSPSVWDKQPYGWMSLASGTVLVVCSLTAARKFT